MRRANSPLLAAIAVSAFLAAACGGMSSSQSPTSPAASAMTMDRLAGTWTSGTAAGGAGNSCTGVTYTINKVSDTSGTVSFSGTCAGITITGTGNGTLSGSVLNWNASGTVTGSGLNCPFGFTNSTAAPQGNDVLVTYHGSVCGIPLDGSQVVHR